MSELVEMWGIYFTSMHGEENSLYMSCLFPTEASANMELDLINKERERHSEHLHLYDLSRCPSVLSGYDFCVKPKMIRPLKTKH